LSDPASILWYEHNAPSIEATREIQDFLDTVTQQDLLDREVWPKLAWFAWIAPDHEVVTIRSAYTDGSDAFTNGTNLLTSGVQIPFAGPELSGVENSSVKIAAETSTPATAKPEVDVCETTVAGRFQA
jgi:hypothetical protein